MNHIKISITPGAFIKNEFLIKKLNKSGFSQIKLNHGNYPLTGSALIELLDGVDGCIIGRERINRPLLSRLSNLKVVSKYGVGTDNIDFKACRDHGVSVLVAQGVNKRSVAELTLSFMVFLIRNFFPASRKLREGIWGRLDGQQLSGKTIGVIGVGNIGKEVVNLLKPFNCEILVNDIIDQGEYYRENNLKECSKNDVFDRSDIVTIHTPLTDLTRHLVNRSVLKQMKWSAFLINTARGEIVNQDDLKWALENRVIAGAALDVFHPEPPVDRDFLGLENLICTPHMGGYAREAVEAMGLAAIENLIDFFEQEHAAR